MTATPTPENPPTAISAPAMGHPARAQEPRISLDDDGTLDDFLATDAAAVHFEAMDESEWWASVRLKNGEVWHLNFGARNPRAKGYARAERVQ